MDSSDIASLVIGSLQNIMKVSGEEIGSIGLDTRLIGGDSVVDSLSFVTLVVDIESRLSEIVGLEVVLTEDPDIFEHDGPFRTVGSLVAYIQENLVRSR